MNEQVQQALRALVTEHGAAIATDAGRCESLLRERCPANKRETALLLGVLHSGVMGELLLAAAGTAAVGRVGMLARRIEDEMGVKADAARWAVESWALALGWPLELAKPAAPAVPAAPVYAPVPPSAPRPTSLPAPPPVTPAPVHVPPQVAPAPIHVPPPDAPAPVPEVAAEPVHEPVAVLATPPASAPRPGNGGWITAAVLFVAVVLYLLWRFLPR